MPWFIDSQWESLGINGFFTLIYLIAIILVKSKDLWLCAFAEVIGKLYFLSPLYNHIDNVSPASTFLIYGFIYLSMIHLLTSYKVMISCFIMLVFQILMYKAYVNGLGNYQASLLLYNSYEILVTAIHILIISTVVWRANKRYLGRYFSHRLGGFGGNSNRALYN